MCLLHSIPSNHAVILWYYSLSEISWTEWWYFPGSRRSRLLQALCWTQTLQWSVILIPRLSTHAFLFSLLCPTWTKHWVVPENEAWNVHVQVVSEIHRPRLQASIDCDSLLCFCQHNSYIPQIEQYDPERRMLFCLGNVTYLLDVTPSNPLPQTLSLPPIPLRVIQLQRFGC